MEYKYAIGTKEGAWLNQYNVKEWEGHQGNRGFKVGRRRHMVCAYLYGTCIFVWHLHIGMVLAYLHDICIFVRYLHMARMDATLLQTPWSCTRFVCNRLNPAGSRRVYGAAVS